MALPPCTTRRVISAVLYPSNCATAPFLLGKRTPRFVSSVASDSAEAQKQSKSQSKPTEQQPKQTKSQAELDKELQLKMQGLSGDGGESGIEYEDGQPVSMKRGVRENMFRYI